MNLAGVLSEAKELDANRRRITKVFFYFLFKIKCLKTYKKAFPFNACGGMGLGGWVFCSGGQNGGQAPIVRADGRGGQGGRRLGGHLLLGLEPFHRSSLLGKCSLESCKTRITPIVVHNRGIREHARLGANNLPHEY